MTSAHPDDRSTGPGTAVALRAGSAPEPRGGAGWNRQGAVLDPATAAAVRELGQELPLLPPALLLPLLQALRATLPMPRPGEQHTARSLSVQWLGKRCAKSPATGEAYCRALVSWLDFCQAGGLDPLGARTPDVDTWTGRLAGRGASASVINQRLAGVRGWYRYLRLGGTATADPVSDADRPSAAAVDESETPYLTIAQTGALLRQARWEVDDAGDDPAKLELVLRVAALVWLLPVTGVRSGGALAARVRGLHYNGGRRRLRYRLKGYEGEVSDALPPQVALALDAYLDCRAARQGLPALTPDAPLFATGSGRRWDKQGATKALRGLAGRAGIPHADKLNLHALRHSAGSSAHNELGIPLDKVRRLLRHRSIATTQIYVHDDLRPGQSVADKLAAAYAAEIELPGSGTLAASPSGPGAATRAAIAAHARVAALHRVADAGDGLPAAVVAEVAATFTALLDRCDGADPAHAPFAETVRALVAGGLPSLADPDGRVRPARP
ncbi:hypothetical protein CU254_42060 (plasmid) [Amycolatopsis sp. AA4]|uniref:tyrosine-type recombinase/integrase n=1 Tax=Actinomycetes TaxID=1760 RepID=UPI0001B56C09|nr:MULTISPECIES: tyrosine-type recombinase/integrase [Actinomycetes]ATY17165.1 hypothetical protein CU254_42060 [Amycolatopsis sp. AA4]EFL12605.1 hypothetical protein SSMG_08276 [Streptomyces sp. AA4]